MSLTMINAGPNGSRRLRTGVWICYASKKRGLVVLLAGVDARIETIEIAAYGTLFAELSLSRYVNRIAFRNAISASACAHDTVGERG
jgi:hypothetical protein